MNTRLLLAALALVAMTGVSQAAAPEKAHSQAATATRVAQGAQAKRSSKHAAPPAKRRQAQALRTTAMDRVRQRVVRARGAQQQRWITNELGHVQLHATQAAALRSWVGELEAEQTSLVRRGHETVDEALAISHEQDLLDWAMRTGHPEFEPPRLLAAS